MNLSCLLKNENKIFIIFTFLQYKEIKSQLCVAACLFKRICINLSIWFLHATQILGKYRDTLDLSCVAPLNELITDIRNFARGPNSTSRQVADMESLELVGV